MWNSVLATRMACASFDPLAESAHVVGRRLGNRGFVTNIHMDEDDELRIENNRPCEMLLDLETNVLTLGQERRPGPNPSKRFPWARLRDSCVGWS